MIDLKRYNELKDRVEQEQKDRARIEGMIDEMTRRLKELYGCATLEEAKKKLRKIIKKAKSYEKKYNQILKDEVLSKLE